MLALTITLSAFKLEEARAEMPVKAKAFLTIVGYGTVGGALLGAASMAFGNSTRNMAMGASIGLYAGIIFGTYVLVSHNQRRKGNYDDNDSPYQDSRDIYGEDYESDEGGSSDSAPGKGDGFLDRMQTINTKFQHRGKNHVPPVYINLINYQF